MDENVKDELKKEIAKMQIEGIKREIEKLQKEVGEIERRLFK